MRAGTSWEGVRWRATRNVRLDLGTPSARMALMLFVLFVGVSMALAIAMAVSADARTCSSSASPPRKIGDNRINGQADVFCSGPGQNEIKTLYMDVFKAQNNFPDPRVCQNQRASRDDDFGVGCSGPFKRGKFGLKRGDYYTFAEGAGGRDYSESRYLVPG